jgi:pimeloyl-ACP methyl ester carboxylesterase
MVRTLHRDLPGVRVAFDVGGEGPGIVLVHGWACRRADFDSIARDLRRDHRVLALDLPWHGDSRAWQREWSMAALGGLVAAVTDAAGLHDAALVGHSMGAAVAVEAALAGAGGRLVALDGLTFMHLYPRQDAAARARVLAPFRQDFPREVRALCERSAAPATDPALTTRVAGEMSAMPAGEGIAMLSALMEWDMDHALERLAARGGRPVALASRWMLSPAVGQAYGAALDIRPVELGGHFYLREDPDGTAAAIRALVAEGSSND